MEVLRIKLTQSSANYKKEETVKNKMTYPLPPFSTVIGALHSACGYKEYHPMDISIQGKYESMHKEPYTDYCFLNSVMDDRGILVKLKNNSLHSTAFDKVAKAIKSQGNSFRKGITIEVINEQLLEEYRQLKVLVDEVKEFKKSRIDKVMAIIKKRKKTLADKKKNGDKDSIEYKIIAKREKEIKQLEKTIKDKLKAYETNSIKDPYSKFASLTTSLKYYEVLNNIELILHIKSDENTLKDIKENIYNLKALGRSEDFVDVQEACFVEVVDEIDDEIESMYSAYIDYDLVKNEDIITSTKKGISADGTKYYLNKNYTIKDNKRVFEKKKVLYTSRYSAHEESEGLYFDLDGDKPYIVNLN
ncbi:CRISPR-associated protein Cas5 [Clostridiaceae bacterium M8S5]|nr:CRISPR-associated protein Cas5 [Clostridiaceae bacterium M8S5]